MTDIIKNRPVLALTIVVLLGALLRLWGITSQPLLDDEVNVAFTAVNYMENGQFGPTMWHHPNLRNIIIYIVGEAFGYTPAALRAMSLTTGILSIPLVWGIVKKLAGDDLTALLASFLLAVEEVHITFSRQALQETWTPFLFLAGCYLFLVYCRQGRKPIPLILSGIFFGAGCASKFHAAFPLLTCLSFCIWTSSRDKKWQRMIFEISSLSLLPFTIYLLTYIPWFARGYRLPDWIFMQQAIIDKMLHHTGNPMDQIIDKKAWQWFLRPMVYGNFVMSEKTPNVTISWSNPLVWLLILPATAHQAWNTWHDENTEKRFGRMAPLVMFIICYLPLATSSRPIWLLTSLAVLPFAFILLARSLAEIACNVKNGIRFIVSYCLLLCIICALTYPVATGRGMHYGYLKPIVESYRSAMEQNNSGTPSVSPTAPH